MNKQVSTLLEKEMTRKEFMATLGFGVASILGFSSIFKLLSGHGSPLAGNQQKSGSHGYGSSSYGG